MLSLNGLLVMNIVMSPCAIVYLSYIDLVVNDVDNLHGFTVSASFIVSCVTLQVALRKHVPRRDVPSHNVKDES